MLKSIYTSITDQSFIICSLASLLLGLLSCIVYSRSHRARKDFTAVLFLMPFIICVVLLVANSLISSFLIVSIFALTRFRTVQYKAEEIMSVFASVVLGLLCATGYVYVAILFTALYSFLLLVYNRISIRTHQMLKVTIPENVSFSALNEPLEKHADYYKLVDYKTTNLGSLYKLTYDVVIKKDINPQDMIDSIRILNGNLEVEVSEFVEVKD